MSIIIISSDAHETGCEIAQNVAEAIGYGYVGRQILSAVAEKYNIPESKLVRALDEAPSFLGLSPKLRKQYMVYIQEATLDRLLEDNVVCYGLAAHLYVLGVSHALKVLILSDPKQIAGRMMSQGKIESKRLKKIVSQQKKARRRWSLESFNLDETDPSNYDLVISLSQIDPSEAVKTIRDTVGYRKFQPMTYSIKCLRDKDLAVRVKVALLEKFPDANVRADGSTVVVETKGLKREKRKKTEAIKELAEAIEGVGYVEVHLINDIFRQAAESSR